VMRDQRIPGFHPNGQLNDDLLARFTELDHITYLDLSGCRQLTDHGLGYLARLPRLTHLNLSGCGNITDRGLEVLRRLPSLESFAASWTPITHAGITQLSNCERLVEVDLGGTRTGDAALGALAGKQALRSLTTGHGITNEGLTLLHALPVFKIWHGGEGNALLGAGARPNQLTLRGAFDDRGMDHLVGLDGLYSLNIWDVNLAVTSACLAPLAQLPHLESLACEATDDAWMARIAALPHLRFLMCQDTPVGDDGFVALSKSRSIEHIWGRRCHNLQRRGFVALADMPALKYLSVSCKNVDDEGLSALPRFPALRELMPMDVPDEGYRHIGKCEQLESLVLMYCRDSGDRATEHITGLRKLMKYFASYNRVTDRTPELLSEISSLESITFDSCAGLTDAGIVKLARLPRLKELSVASMRHVTADVVSAFPATVKVKWSV
jgi:F-box/leucine-rich repeat protein 14